MYFTALFIFGLFVSCFIDDFGIIHHWEKSPGCDRTAKLESAGWWKSLPFNREIIFKNLQEESQRSPADTDVHNMWIEGESYENYPYP